MTTPPTQPAPNAPAARLTLLPTHGPHGRNVPDGAWWPRSRCLAKELPALIAAWPVDRGYISRVLFSPPDWDDHPRSVMLPTRHIKTGAFPHDDTHELILTLADHTDRVITVLAPGTDDLDASAVTQWLDDGGR